MGKLLRALILIPILLLLGGLMTARAQTVTCGPGTTQTQTNGGNIQCQAQQQSQSLGNVTQSNNQSVSAVSSQPVSTKELPRTGPGPLGLLLPGLLPLGWKLKDFGEE